MNFLGVKAGNVTSVSDFHLAAVQLVENISLMEFIVVLLVDNDVTICRSVSLYNISF